ncbi:DUF1320 domain-containing protein [bacterium]|nr:DUF1320 domain-containing protein [bacterium]
MAYATQIDIEARLAHDLLAWLADDDIDGMVDESPIAQAIEDASAVIDAYLGRRYQTPIEQPPAVVRSWCVDLAIEELFLRKRQAITPEHAQRTARAYQALEAIAAGRESLDGAEPLLGDFATECSRLDDEPVFGKDELDLF